MLATRKLTARQVAACRAELRIFQIKLAGILLSEVSIGHQGGGIANGADRGYGVGAAEFSDLNRLLVIGTEAVSADYIGESDRLGRLTGRRRRMCLGDGALAAPAKSGHGSLKH